MGLAYYNIIDPHMVGISFELPPREQFDPVVQRQSDPDYAKRWRPCPGYYAVDVNFVKGGTFFTVNGRGQFDFVSRHDYEYFRYFTPIAKAGYSIFIYHITLEDANRFRREWGLPLLTEEASTSGKSP